MYVVVFRESADDTPDAFGPFNGQGHAKEWAEDTLGLGQYEIIYFHNVAPVTATTACSNHNPVQHRDAKTAWCESCGLTVDYQKPESFLGSGRDPLQNTFRGYN